jgi:hypothetical protein
VRVRLFGGSPEEVVWFALELGAWGVGAAGTGVCLTLPGPQHLESSAAASRTANVLLVERAARDA